MIHLIVSFLLQTSHLPTALCMKSKSLSTPSRPVALPNLLPPLGLVACCPSDLIQPSHPPGRQALPPRPDQLPFCGVSEHPVPLMWGPLHGVVSLLPQDQEPSLSVPPCTLGALHLLTADHRHRPALLLTQLYLMTTGDAGRTATIVVPFSR